MVTHKRTLRCELPVDGQQGAEVVFGGHLGQTAEDIAEVCHGVDASALAGCNDRVDDGRALGGVGRTTRPPATEAYDGQVDWQSAVLPYALDMLNYLVCYATAWLFVQLGRALQASLADRKLAQQLNAARRIEDAVRDRRSGLSYDDAYESPGYVVTADIPPATGRVLQIQEEEIRRFRREFRRPVNIA